MDGFELARDPWFAEAALGTAVAPDWAEQFGDQKPYGRPDDLTDDVHLIGKAVAERVSYAEGADASLVPDGEAENAIADRMLERASQVVPLPRNNAARAFGGTGLPPPDGSRCPRHPR